MADTPLLISTRALLQPHGIVSDASIVVVGDRITAIGATRDLLEDPEYDHATRLDWRDRLVVPGTVNAHNHSFQSLLRGIGDDLPFLEWRDRALYRYSPGLSAHDMETAALFAFGEMLLHGVTTVCDFYYVNRGGNAHARATIEAARKLGMRVVLARCFYDWDGAPSAYREEVSQAVHNFEELHDHYRAMWPWVSVHPAPHSQHGASPAMIEAGAGCARDRGTPWHIHLAEEAYQVEESLRRFGQRPLQAIAELSVIDRSMIAIHGCWFDEGERALLAERDAALVYNPASNMFLGDGITDVVDLVRRGCRVGLGTDGGCSNNRVSVFDEMRMTALLQKVAAAGDDARVRAAGQWINAERCFAMGTEIGGSILGLPVGIIEPGACADLVAIDADDLSLAPLQALRKNLVYALSPRAITGVVVGGREVVRDQHLVGVDEASIRERVRDLTRDWSAEPPR